MFRNFFLVIILVSVVSVFYGIIKLFHDVEPNSCRMTYMFGQPQFSRVAFDEGRKFPNYGLYYYYEGPLIKNVNHLKLTGAPVIFVPGNGGSLKQVRSLASVALRKSMDDNDVKLDYFTIDFNEELSGLFGGYLKDQVNFLKASIKAVLNLYTDNYKHERKVVLIGHSIGGKIAQAALTHLDLSDKINTILCISSPLDTPVINLDSGIHYFYSNTNDAMSTMRNSLVPHNNTNYCNSNLDRHLKVNDNNEMVSRILDNVLMISIGGGNRDILVREGLTTSKFSDIHVLTASIPNVWLSCDHLSAVWCLQLMLVVNRFLFEISQTRHNKYVTFIDSKYTRLSIAKKYFGIKTRKGRQKLQELNFDIVNKDSRRVFGKKVPTNTKKVYSELITLSRNEKYRNLYIDVFNYERTDWLYGCTVTEDDRQVCTEASELAHYVEQIPSKDRLRSKAKIDFSNIRKTFTNWTHVVIRIPPISKQVYYNIDIYDPSVRHFDIVSPRWFSTKSSVAINETVQGTVHYSLRIQGLQESFHGIEILIEPTACIQKSYSVTAKICVPWAFGFDKYHVLSENTGNNRIFINVPFSPPLDYNTTKNPVVVDMFLDPVCRYRISYTFSLAHTMSRIVKEFYSWIPSHFVAVLIIVLKNNLGKTLPESSIKTLKPFTGFFQYNSIYIITGCRLLKKLLTPRSAETHNSYYVLVIVHSTAIVLSIVAAFVIWVLIVCNSNLLHKIMLRLTRISFTPSSILVSVLNQLPLAVGVVTVSIAYASCSGVALLFAFGYYFLTLSGAYKDYLEHWVWKKATSIFKRKQIPQALQTEDESKLITDGADSFKTNTELALKDEEKNEEVTNFPYHFALFILLTVIVLLNIPMTIAWVRNRRAAVPLPDSTLISTIATLCSIAILHQVKAPNNLISHKVMAVLLYAAACASVLYCQYEVFRLNIVVASVFVLLTAHEIFALALSRFIHNVI